MTLSFFPNPNPSHGSTSAALQSSVREMTKSIAGIQYCLTFNDKSAEINVEVPNMACLSQMPEKKLRDLATKVGMTTGDTETFVKQASERFGIPKNVIIVPEGRKSRVTVQRYK